MTWRGVFSGALALIALQAAVGSAKGATRVGQAGEWIANGVRSAMSPTVPAIPDLTGSGRHGKWRNTPS